MAAGDPHAVLQVGREASPAEITAAYRRAAKRWHPDRAGAPEAAARMAEANDAYELLRSGLWQEQRSRATPSGGSRHVRGRGAWLSEDVRRALGSELLSALAVEEPVGLVSPAATWASPRALLAVTDRRLVWLLDDAPVRRVRFVRLGDVAAISARLAWPRRRSAVLEARTVSGRKLAWSELRPITARRIVRHVEARNPGYAGAHGS